ncbi:MAG: hypothetical protein ABEH43_09375, partial [Flavobacteriales bacterium]
VEVTVDPNEANQPLVEEDSIMFLTNGNEQKVGLVAWGQDAYFHQNVLACNIGWKDDKPHVIYGTVAVDTGCVLQIDAGTQVHFHNNSRLLVLKNGK